MRNEIAGLLTIIVTFICALVLQIIPLPAQFDVFRPDWVLACLVYWCIALPFRVNIVSAFVVGLLLDLLLGSILGVRSLTLSLVAYVAVINYTRMRNLSLWQQAIGIGLLTLLSKVIVFWIEYVLNGVHLPHGYFYSVVTTMIIWPWVYLFLRKLRRRFRLE
ncbi:MAG: Rod shape-determining protein MreD [Candidatus Celerinatantimonas neptuna]|nr:MAG: Rod shape-determining protein MreD [Candidatus Celerinatantimonas neptuna]